MDFGDALKRLKAGDHVAREGWNGPGQWLKLQRPDANSKMTLPYIYISTVQADLVPWLASQTDLLAEDWRVALVPGAEGGVAEAAKAAGELLGEDWPAPGPLLDPPAPGAMAGGADLEDSAAN